MKEVPYTRVLTPQQEMLGESSSNWATSFNIKLTDFIKYFNKGIKVKT